MYESILICDIRCNLYKVFILFRVVLFVGFLKVWVYVIWLKVNSVVINR